MFDIKIAEKTLKACLATGADFAEIFYEDTYTSQISMYSGKVEKASENHLYGAGIRLLKENAETYGYTSDVSEKGLLTLAEKLRTSFSGDPAGIEFELKE